jgi:hypothetical protein
MDRLPGFLIIFALGLLLTIVPIQGFRHNHALSVRSETAEPVRMERYTAHKWLFFTAYYDANIKFATKDGKQIEALASIPEDVLQKFQSQEPVTIEYLPEDPEITRFSGHRSDPLTMAILELLLGISFIVFGFMKMTNRYKNL